MTSDSARRTSDARTLSSQASAAVGLEQRHQERRDDVDQRKDGVASVVVGAHVDGCGHEGHAGEHLRHAPPKHDGVQRAVDQRTGNA
jgi:hypothetical protein